MNHDSSTTKKQRERGNRTKVVVEINGVTLTAKDIKELRRKLDEYFDALFKPIRDVMQGEITND